VKLKLLSEVGFSMKTLRVSDRAHRELTRWLGELMAQTGKPQTFSDVIEALVSRSVLLPPELLRRMDEYVEANKQLGYKTLEEFYSRGNNRSIPQTFRQIRGGN